MLEQFRILSAALRLHEFSIAALADESGVSVGTVQKTLRRRTDIFTGRKGQTTGKPGGQPRLYRIQEVALRNALQMEANSIDLPKTDPGLGVALAEDALCRMLPAASPEERMFLLAAATENLRLPYGAEHQALHDELSELNGGLRVIVSMERWLASRQKVSAEDAIFGSVVSILRTVTSDTGRKRRDDDVTLCTSVREQLARFQLNVTILTANQSLEQIDEAPPITTWWLLLPAAVLLVVGHSKWRHVTGDLTDPVPLLVSLASAAWPLGKETTASPVPLPKTPLVPATDLLRDWLNEAPVYDRTPHFHIYDGASIRAGKSRVVSRMVRPPSHLSLGNHPALLSEDGGDVRDMAKGLVRIHVDHSFGPFMTVSVGRTDQPIGMPSTHLINSFDFNFRARRIMGAMVAASPLSGSPVDPSGSKAPAPAASPRWVQFAELRELNGVKRERTSIFGKGSIPLLPVGFSSMIERVDVREGAYITDRQFGMMQVRLNPGHEIDVYEADSGLDHRLSGNDARSGYVCWLDFSLTTGQVVWWHVKQTGSKKLLQIPSDDLEYDAGRRCFILRAPVGTDTPPMFGAMIAGIDRAERKGPLQH